jgi:hypothetical protein
MNRNAIDVGAFSWARIQRLYDPDAGVHWQRCEAEGLQCPQEMVAQLFHEKANDEDFAVIVRSIDYSALGTSPLANPWGPPRSGVRQRSALSWGRVSLELSEMSLAAQLGR